MYISILRGINVSGQKKIKMADLKSLYEKSGFNQVRTYIQSGNVLFESKIKDKADIRQTLETVIENHYGFKVPVDVRTKKDFQAIVKACPYEEAKLAENGTKILVSFLSRTPTASQRVEMEKHAVAPERLICNKDVIYLFCPNGYGKSKLSNTFIESKLGLTATTRNWKTVCTLLEMSQ
ncbi:MAG: DUF1697 domain-containing protein [Gammaproteobacteria bacterium]|nr:DUF1697 domain-containing protein [Gammaproteobacteria bacterium]